MIKAAVITGASGGFGAEIAALFAADGHNLVLVARSSQNLEALADSLERAHGVQAIAAPLDLTIPSAPDVLYAEIQRRGIQCTALVNNADAGPAGPFIEIDLARELAVLHLNVLALTHLTKLLARQMAPHGGKILNVASTAAFQAGPFRAVTSAAQAYVLSFSEALSEELRPLGISVTALCPGPARAGAEETAGSRRARPSARVDLSAAEVARAGYLGMMRGRPLVIPGFRNRVLALAVRAVPRAAAARMALRLSHEPPFPPEGAEAPSGHSTQIDI